MSTILELKGVHAGYGNDPDILKGVDLRVEEGGSCCIIGPNGAGKSTVLKTIAGILPLRSGEVLFKGKSLAKLRPTLRSASRPTKVLSVAALRGYFSLARTECRNVRHSVRAQPDGRVTP